MMRKEKKKTKSLLDTAHYKDFVLYHFLPLQLHFLATQIFLD